LSTVGCWLGLGAFITVLAFYSAAGTVYSAALYRFAVDGRPPPAFAGMDLARAFHSGDFPADHYDGYRQPLIDHRPANGDGPRAGKAHGPSSGREQVSGCRTGRAASPRRPPCLPSGPRSRTASGTPGARNAVPRTGWSRRSG